MLTSLGSLDRPGHMKMIWKRIVNRFDVGIVEQFLVRAVRFGDANGARRGFGFGVIARGDAHYLSPLALLHCRDYFANSDGSSAENSPSNFFARHSYPSRSSVGDCNSAQRK